MIVVLTASLFQINEGQRGISIRFGRVLKNADQTAHVYEPGIHLKVPFFDRIKILDARIQTMSDQADRFVTSEKKDVIIDSYVKWRIKDFSKFYLSTGSGNVLTAEGLLKRKVSDGLRAEIGNKTIKEIVYEKRDAVMSEVLTNAKESAKDLGIEVVDFRIKKMNLPDEISESIYQRMRAERESVARSYRSHGREQAEITRAQAELEVAKTLAEADRISKVIRGNAEAKVAQIYAQSYQKDPEFYNFFRSLQAYENSFTSKNDVLVLSPDTEFFKYLKNGDAVPQTSK